MTGLNPLNAELNPICHLLALLGAHHIFHVSGLRVNFISSVASNTFEIGVGVCVKGNFVDELGNLAELVEILSVRAVG